VHLRPKRFRATVTISDTPRRPIVLTVNSGLQFDLELDEAHQLALALRDAIEAVQHAGGGQGC
jgi:hypothetical protein